MNINDLKSNWKNIQPESKKTTTDLLKMTKVRNHPTLKRIRIKLIIESILLIAFLAVYNNIFDGAQKPTWVNIMLIIAAGLFVLVDLSAYLNLKNIPQGKNLKETLQQFSGRLKLISTLSLISSLLFGTALILFFTSSINFTENKYFILIGIILTLLLMIFASYKIWANRINHITKTIADLE
ncbi:hypothetical protein JKA74_11430 [Marivirga sp. S37H4]|uniref:Uncharacterized protein n=1 Tax=Marivirga aurantiaca TaxID=2802615 RepID=A0A934WZG0_9BACT|nr:hypothetical protein [Marivirga aurantiaca]MBK6265650.1 hypothetical protein [Marivirga aurantiaca]